MCRSNIDTLALVKKRAEQFTGLPEDVGRFHIIKGLKTVGDRLGFGSSHVNYLELLVSYTHESDWQGGNKCPIVWLSVNEIARKLNLSRRRINQIETDLVALQAIAPYDYGNYRRFGSRDDDGTVKFAYGIDLRPLGLLWENLAHKIKLKRQTDRQWKETRHAVSALRRQIGDILRSGHQAVADVINVVASDSAMTSRIGQRLSLDDLKGIYKTLQKWLEKLVKTLAETVVASPAEKGPLYAKISYECEENCSHHIIPTNIPKVVSELESEADKPVSESELPFKGRCSVSLAYDQRQRKKRGRGSPPPLRDIMDAASPRLREQLIDHNNPSQEQVTNPSTDDLIDACRRLAPMLGISSSLWREATGQLNPYGASLALIVIDARHSAGEIYSPGGCLRGMLEKDKVGELNINASLYGVVDRAMREEAY